MKKNKKEKILKDILVFNEIQKPLNKILNTETRIFDQWKLRNYVIIKSEFARYIHYLYQFVKKFQIIKKEEFFLIINE